MILLAKCIGINCQRPIKIGRYYLLKPSKIHKNCYFILNIKRQNGKYSIGNHRRFQILGENKTIFKLLNI